MDLFLGDVIQAGRLLQGNTQGLFQGTVKILLAALVGDIAEKQGICVAKRGRFLPPPIAGVQESDDEECRQSDAYFHRNETQAFLQL